MDQQPVPPIPPQQPPNDGSQQPVAYDSQGRPLYAAPPQQPQTQQTPQSQPLTPQQQAEQPQFVHFSRAVEPEQPPISPETKARHDQSVREFPHLNLSEAEFVISAVRRHPIGLVFPVGITVLSVGVIASLLINLPLIMQSSGALDASAYGLIWLVGIMMMLLFLIGGYVSVWVYTNNKFFLTNESVIQEIQTSLFSRREQTVSLLNIEDASFRQQGILQMLFNYGSIRLSTEGDETTYRFNYVANPKEQIAILNNAVESFKNGRPIAND